MRGPKTNSSGAVLPDGWLSTDVGPTDAIIPRDPAAPFWAAITADPAAPGPRLEFSDWCDENGDETMAAVLRWCVATGRWPGHVDGGYIDSPLSWWVWWRQGGRDAEFPADIPPRLFQHLPDTGRRQWMDYKSRHVGSSYHTCREALLALAHAWRAATRRGWFRRAWVPDYTPVGG